MADASLHTKGSDLKHCGGCNAQKPLSGFNKKPSGAPLSQCRECRKAACRAWYQRNLESERARARARARIYGPEERRRNKEWAAANPERARYHSRNKLFKKKYGLTVESHEALFASQGFVCAACGVDDPKSKKGWSTDHCHATGRVRGILCHHCNVGLGHAKDDLETLRKWIAYLQRTPSK